MSGIVLMQATGTPDAWSISQTAAPPVSSPKKAPIEAASVICVSFAAMSAFTDSHQMKCPAWPWPAFSDGAARFGPIGKSGRYRHLRASLQGEGLEISGKRHFAVSHHHSDLRQQKLFLIDPVLIPAG